jgi:hypothetical protein
MFTEDMTLIILKLEELFGFVEVQLVEKTRKDIINFKNSDFKKLNIYNDHASFYIMPSKDKKLKQL